MDLAPQGLLNPELLPRRLRGILATCLTSWVLSEYWILLSELEGWTWGSEPTE